MARPRERVCLQDGLKLDSNRLARKGFVQAGASMDVRGITWTHSYWGEIASGTISADMTDAERGWFRVSSVISISGSISLHVREISVAGNVFYLPSQKSTGFGAMEAKWCNSILQPQT